MKTRNGPLTSPETPTSLCDSCVSAGGARGTDILLAHASHASRWATPTDKTHCGAHAVERHYKSALWAHPSGHPSQEMDCIVINTASRQLKVWHRHRVLRRTSLAIAIAAFCCCIGLFFLPKEQSPALPTYVGVENAISMYESSELVDLRSTLTALEADLQELAEDDSSWRDLSATLYPVTTEIFSYQEPM